MAVRGTSEIVFRTLQGTVWDHSGRFLGGVRGGGLPSSLTTIPIHQLLTDLQLLPQERTVVLQWIPSRCGIPGNERTDRLSSLRANSYNPCPPPLTRRPKPYSKTVKDANGEEPLETTIETTTPLQTDSTVWQDMSRPLYSGCEEDIVACEYT